MTWNACMETNSPWSVSTVHLRQLYTRCQVSGLQGPIFRKTFGPQLQGLGSEVRTTISLHFYSQNSCIAQRAVLQEKGTSRAASKRNRTKTNGAREHYVSESMEQVRPKNPDFDNHATHDKGRTLCTRTEKFSSFITMTQVEPVSGRSRTQEALQSQIRDAAPH